METLQGIKLNYDKALRQAEELEAVAKDMDRIAQQDFRECLDGLSAGWKGENALAYIRKGDRIRQDLEKSAGRLQEIAAAVRSIAERTRDADIQAGYIAKEK